ncbi:hypothetical protein Pint_27892 [Pistacia integerrima]|uniref:Uncharacterized protein n=1 Tax=Pistacia integerrima TaxID=434235 RepID=A0ACC0YQX4_9ROSI|nr:hypothetical protein Pint_27892 [Pistacia integerrima]
MIVMLDSSIHIRFHGVQMWVSLHIHCFCCVYNGHRKIPSTQPLISRSYPAPV